jgi:DNA-binding MarR family transcriptional regulator
MERLSLHAFADRLNEIMPLIMKGFFRKQASPLVGTLSPAQFLLLNYLQGQGESTMTAVARHLEVTTAAVTGLVERLVRDGYVQRLSDPRDRRIIKVRLSAKGSSLLTKLTEQKRAVILKVFSRISERDRREYLRIVTQVRDIISEASDE